MRIIVLFILSHIFFSTGFASSANDACKGPFALLSIVDRPSNASSACIVPVGYVEMESGYLYQKVTEPKGFQQSAPNFELQLGLSAKDALVVLAPIYVHQTVVPKSGVSSTSIGLKHQFGYNDKWIVTGLAYITPESGSFAYGSAGTAGLVTGIFSYAMNDKINITLMFGASTEYQSVFDGGKRFESINPMAVLSYSLKENTSLYVEIYGQSKIAPGAGSGFNTDFGVSYLVNPSLVLDIEAGQRLIGHLGGFEHYVGAGLSVMIG